MSACEPTWGKSAIAMNPRSFDTPLTIEEAVDSPLNQYGDADAARSHRVVGKRWGRVFELMGKELEIAQSIDPRVEIRIELYHDSVTSQIKNDWIIVNNANGDVISPLYLQRSSGSRGLMLSVFALIKSGR